MLTFKLALSLIITVEEVKFQKDEITNLTSDLTFSLVDRSLSTYINDRKEVI